MDDAKGKPTGKDEAPSARKVSQKKTNSWNNDGKQSESETTNEMRLMGRKQRTDSRDKVKQCKGRERCFM